MAYPHTDDLYPPADIPKRHIPWFSKLLVAFALLVLAAVALAFWNMGKMPARTLELPGAERPGADPASNPPEDRPLHDAPLPAPVTPTPTPVMP